jgi:hypothetical protein
MLWPSAIGHMSASRRRSRLHPERVGMRPKLDAMAAVLEAADAAVLSLRV